MENYSDTDLTFFLHWYHDYNWLDKALAFLRDCYSSPRVIVVSDGDANPRYQDLVAKYRIDLSLESTRLFLKEHGRGLSQTPPWRTMRTPRAKDNKPLQNYVESTGRTSTDWAVGYCARNLNIALLGHPEVLSLWRPAQTR
jgi:hypothetical protein